MTDIIRNWIFGPSDFEKPDPVKKVKRRKKKVVKIIEEELTLKMKWLKKKKDKDMMHPMESY